MKRDFGLGGEGRIRKEQLSLNREEVGEVKERESVYFFYLIIIMIKRPNKI